MPSTSSERGEESFPLIGAQQLHHAILAAHPEVETAIGTSYRLTGPLDAERLVRALERTVRRHDALRIGVSDEHGRQWLGRQWVQPLPAMRDLLTFQEIKARDERQFARYATAMLATDVRSPWDLCRGLPFRFRLYRYSPDLHALLCSFSHLALDLHGCDIVLREIWNGYLSADMAEDRAEKPAGSFAQAAKEHASRPKRPIGALPRPYRSDDWVRRPGRWRAECIGGSPEESAVLSLCDGALTALREDWHRRNVTEFQGLVTAVAAAVFELSDEQELHIAIPVDTRRVHERETAGMFAIPASVFLRRAPSVEQLLEQVRREVYLAVMRAQTNPRELVEEHLATSLQNDEDPRRINISYIARKGDEDGFKVGDLTVVQGAYDVPVRYIPPELEVQAVGAETVLRLQIFFGGALACDRFAGEMTARLHGALSAVRSEARMLRGNGPTEQRGDGETANVSVFEKNGRR
ncbi:condensation domain-containing protein [Actinomadura chokoriensis]|uniref:Condensation domain-containing protein n=1 Tax=Actinomadura chokoriensis TaxID=454156 RepID=A0ABV4QY65_9ACTN